MPGYHAHWHCDEVPHHGAMLHPCAKDVLIDRVHASQKRAGSHTMPDFYQAEPCPVQESCHCFRGEMKQVARYLPRNPPFSKHKRFKALRVGNINQQESRRFKDSMGLTERVHGIVDMLQRMTEHDHIKKGIRICCRSEFTELDLETMFGFRMFHRDRAEIDSMRFPALIAKAPQ